ncbi:hypothetical protein QZH41_018348, partial [Actinostola sp. cb2023]
MSDKQLVKSKSGLRMVSTSESDRSPFLLEEPHWEDDALFPNCIKCNKKFDFTHRRLGVRLICKNIRNWYTYQKFTWATFVIDDSSPLNFLCKLEHTSHREILFECDGDAYHEPVALVRLVSVQLIADKE